MRFRHPDDERLRRWLDDDDPQLERDLGRHVIDCAQCATSIERLVVTADDPDVTRPPADDPTLLDIDPPLDPVDPATAGAALPGTTSDDDTGRDTDGDTNTDSGIDSDTDPAENESALAANLRIALSVALAPSEGLTDRLTAGVTDRLSSRQVASLMADIFGAGLETTRLLLIEGHDDTD